MRRVLVILVAALAVGAGALASLGAADDAGTEYKLVFDNAFGLVEGADFKVGGVSVGAIEKLDVQRSDMRALITVSVKDGRGFGAIRTDAQCMVLPQSLIGEYFVDCQPGTQGRPLKPGDTLPVRNTESPIPPDLVLNIMRLPQRERFRIIFNELGAGLAARGDDLNDTIRRAVPALGATRRVLRILGDNRRTLAALSRDSGRVLKVLGERREDVGRFVTSARGLAETTADRRTQLAETIRRFPGFLDELQPTMADLGTAARLQTPAMADLRAAAPDVVSLLSTLRPFTRALRPATTSLGETSLSGRTAARESRELVAALAGLGRNSGEPANNLAVILSDLDDRSRAVEPDPDSPGGKGYTGLEAPLQYMFDQALALNIFDQRGYSLKLNINPDECSDYTTAEGATEDEEARERYERCSQALGPNQPGITTPDPSPPDPSPSDEERRGDRADSRARQPSPDADAPKSETPRGDAPAPDLLDRPLAPGLPPVKELLDRLPRLLDPLQKGGVDPSALLRGRDAAAKAGAGDSAQDLLDFLLAP